MADCPDTEAIAARLKETTEGPWVWMFTGEKSNGWAMGAWQHEDGTWVPVGETLGDYEMERYEKFGDTDPLGEVTIIEQVCESFNGNNYADADFIAHARQDIPALLAALATAEERADELAQAIQRMMRWCSPGKTAEQIGTEALANYHKATGPQAAPKIENAAPGATGEGS